MPSYKDIEIIRGHLAGISGIEPWSGKILLFSDPNSQMLGNRAIKKMIREGVSRPRPPVVDVSGGDSSLDASILMHAVDKAAGGILLIHDIGWLRSDVLEDFAYELSKTKSTGGKPTMVIGLESDHDSSKKWLEALEGKADALGVSIFRVYFDGVTSASAPSTSISLDLDVINKHRASLGMAKLDPSAGWSAKEISDMAQSIRTTGRMTNPRKQKSGQEKFKPRTDPGAYRLKQFLSTHYHPSGVLFPEDPLTYIEHSEGRGGVRVYVDSRVGPVWVDLDRLVVVEPEFALHGGRGETAIGKQRREKEARSERARQVQAQIVQTSLDIDLKPDARQRKLFNPASLKRKLMR